MSDRFRLRRRRIRENRVNSYRKRAAEKLIAEIIAEERNVSVSSVLCEFQADRAIYGKFAKLHCISRRLARYIVNDARYNKKNPFIFDKETVHRYKLSLVPVKNSMYGLRPRFFVQDEPRGNTALNNGSENANLNT